MEGYLEEMLLLCQRSEEYNQFIAGKLAEDHRLTGGDAPPDPSQLATSFNNLLRELVAYYINMV